MIWNFYRAIAIIIVMVGMLNQTFAQADNQKCDTLLPALYLDCHECDFDYFRDEIGFVNFVVDRKVADIHLLITDARTGSRGREYTLFFYGYNRCLGKSDTLVVTTLPDDTDEIIRAKLVNTSELGLLSMLVHTPMINQLVVSVDLKDTEQVMTDHWNNWVFRTRFGGTLIRNKKLINWN